MGRFDGCPGRSTRLRSSAGMGISLASHLDFGTEQNGLHCLSSEPRVSVVTHGPELGETQIPKHIWAH